MIPAIPDRWERPTGHPELTASTTHVWRIPLDQTEHADPHMGMLSADEQERVRRFYFPHHGRRYAIAHSALRQILAAYDRVHPLSLQFSSGEHGKPELIPSADRAVLHFNLSHSGDLALLAVARHGAVGVDVERWRTNVQHLEIAERFFSPMERDALRGLPDATPESESVLRGFFSTWSRKEAYLKATGHGITRGLYHFDVTMEIAGEPAHQPSTVHDAEDHGLSRVRQHSVSARLIEDRLDPRATERWEMTHLDVGAGYSGALVSARPVDGSTGAVALFESPYI